MTALAGFWRFAGADEGSRAACLRMLQAQQVYAPDPPAQWSGGGISFGRRLFKLLPEDRFDLGPALSPQSGNMIVADVRIDNRGDLRARLGLTGAEADRTSDAQLLLSALDRWGEDSLNLVVGDFAFAHWSPRERKLLLARDFFGQRPLHYHAGDGFFAFATMPKGLHALSEVPRAPDEDSVTRFAALMPESGTGSFFRGVHRVPPGHMCEVTPHGVSLRRYWNPERKLLRLKSSGEYDEAVREAMDQAVSARLRGAGDHLATHLSGGLDSSVVTATAARLLGPGARLTAMTSVPRDGFSAVMPRGRFGDESQHAAALAAMYPQIEHVLVRAGGTSPVANLDRSFFLYERPVLNLCNGTWTEAICQQAKERRIHVLLTGQSGNMTFSYAGLELLPGLLASGRLITLARQLVGLRRNGIRLTSGLSHAVGAFLPSAIWRAVNRLAGRRFRLSDYCAVRADAAGTLSEEAARAGLDFSYRPRRDPFAARLWTLQRVDVGNYMKGQLGGWGVDSRDPTADRRLVELCLSIPAEQFLRRGRPRALARSAFADRLPPEISGEMRKGLQATDWHEGFNAARAEVVEEVSRICAAPEASASLDVSMMKRLVDEWPADGWDTPAATRLYRLALLRGISAGHFIRRSAGSNA